MRRLQGTRGACAALGVGLLLLAACGGEETVEAGDAAGREGSVAGEAADTGPVGDRTDEQPDAEAFGALLEGDAPVAITYEASGDEAEGLTLTFARDGIATAIAGSLGPGAFRMLQPGDGSLVVCGQEAGAWECVRLTGLGELLGVAAVPLAPVFLDLREILADAAWERVEPTTIAGRTALCASTSFGLLPDATEVEGRTEICADEETGALLRMASEGAGGALARLEAVDVGDPDPALLSPPAEPLDLDLLGELLDGLGLGDLDLDGLEDLHNLDLDNLDLDNLDLDDLLDGGEAP